MALFEWSGKYSVKVQSIDREHQTLFSMMNELHVAMKQGQGSKVVPVILERLVDYTRKHLINEENLMLKAQYPEFASHKAEHDRITKEVMTMKKSFDDGNTAISVTLVDFLNKWLQGHILGRDMKYSEPMLAVGIK